MPRGFDLTDYSWFNIRLGLDFITKKKQMGQSIQEWTK